VQGVILLGVQKFARVRFGSDFWRIVETEADVVGRLYLPSQFYPTAEVDSVIGSVSRHSGMSIPMVLESIGDYIAPDVLGAYGSLLDPQWDLLDVLLHSDAIVERAALKLGVKLPESPIYGRPGPNGEIVLTYHSPWRICHLIKGLLRGLGAHMEQPVLIDELRCVTAHSPECEFSVKVERVRPSRHRMASVPNGLANPRSIPGDRPSSLPPSPGHFPRPDSRSTPGLTGPASNRYESPSPTDSMQPPKRTTNIPPPGDSDSGVFSLDSFKNRRR
jgi:hypothetical protein